MNVWINEEYEKSNNTNDKKMSNQDSKLSDGPVSTEYFGIVEADSGLPIVTSLPRFSTVTSGIVNVTLPVTQQQSNQDNFLESLIIPLYGTIFFLSIVGNSLVLITLARNKRMRTVTNVYLLNLVSLPRCIWILCTKPDEPLDIVWYPTYYYSVI